MKRTGTISVTGRDGLRGMIDSSIDVEKVDRVLVKLDDGRSLWIPASLLMPQHDGGYTLPVSLDQLSPEGHDGQQESVMVIPVIAEEVQVSREQRTTGKVRIHKEVREEEQWIDEPGFRDQVDVERIPVHKVIDTPAEVRYEGDTMIIPVMEEVVIVEKRLFLKEEIRVTKHREEIREPKSVKLKKEEVKVERAKSSGRKNPND